MAWAYLIYFVVVGTIYLAERYYGNAAHKQAEKAITQSLIEIKEELE